MQSIRNAVFGSSETTQSGSEPVSGETGSGTTDQPYDAGNTEGVETGGAPTTEADPNASENTFARDRGGPTPGNAGPHATSIANKLDPNVDSDQDGKPKAGPNDFETTTGQENESSYTGANTSSNTTGPSGLTGEDGSSTTAGNTTGAGTTGTSDEYSSTNTKDNADVSTNDSSADRYTGQDDTTTSSTSGGENATGGQPRPLHDTEGTGVTSGQTNDPKFSDEKQSSANDSSVADRGQDKAPVGGVGAVEPSVEADPSSGQKPMQKQQGSGRPMEEPSGEQTDAIKDKKDAAEDTQAGGEGDAEGNQGAGSGNVKKDPDDHSGEPLGAVPHGGSSEEEKTPHPGQEGGKKSEGTGEQWVKTSGLAADGGDFDATKPGAGREADRLLEQKGIHRSEAPGGGVSTDDGAASPGGDNSSKVSMGQKIKDKLHIGKKS